MSNLPQLSSRKLSDLSKIQVDFFIGDSQSYHKILVVKYTGDYPYGSAGNRDAKYMLAMGEAGLLVWEPSGVIVDFSNLNYQWGDALEMVFNIGAHSHYEDVPLPMALVVGKECEEALRSLIVGLNRVAALDTVEWVFWTLKDAWLYVEEKITHYTLLR